MVERGRGDPGNVWLILLAMEIGDGNGSDLSWGSLVAAAALGGGGVSWWRRLVLAVAAVGYFSFSSLSLLLSLLLLSCGSCCYLSLGYRRVYPLVIRELRHRRSCCSPATMILYTLMENEAYALAIYGMIYLPYVRMLPACKHTTIHIILLKIIVNGIHIDWYYNNAVCHSPSIKHPVWYRIFFTNLWSVYISVQSWA